jgi:2-polyprenyl-3-methyl-5-hydroxy-6-metoxy-1,4-benzoquinol methylase
MSHHHDAQPWNHNTHHYPDVLRALPDEVGRVLDVGCGDGMLARQLKAKAAEVVGMDRSGRILSVATAAEPRSGVSYLHGDLLAAPLRPESFDAVVSVAALHHMDPAAGLIAMRDLLRPGGRLVVVDVARLGSVADVPAEIAGFVLHRLRKRQHGYRESAAPQLPPSQTYAEIRKIARALLPGCAFRRRAMWRYTLSWTKPRGMRVRSGCKWCCATTHLR